MTTRAKASNKPRIVLNPGLCFVDVSNETGKKITNLRYIFRPAGSNKTVSIKLASSLDVKESRTFELVDNSLLPVEARLEYWIGLKKISSPVDTVFNPKTYIREHSFYVPLVYKPNTFYALMQACFLPGAKGVRDGDISAAIGLGAAEYARTLQWNRTSALAVKGFAKELSRYIVRNEWIFDVVILNTISSLTLFAISEDGTKQTLEAKQTFAGSIAGEAVCTFSFPANISPFKSVKLQWQYNGDAYGSTITARSTFVWAAFLVLGDDGGPIWWKESDDIQ